MCVAVCDGSRVDVECRRDEQKVDKGPPHAVAPRAKCLAQKNIFRNSIYPRIGNRNREREGEMVRKDKDGEKRERW